MAINISDLQKIIQEPSAAARAEVAEKISLAFAEGEFIDNEKRIAIEIFRLLVKDVEIQVRKILSNNLAESIEAPHDVILKLASDLAEISLPVLEKSFVLTESDLIDITKSSKNVEVMSAIARREIISPELSVELVKKENPQVIKTLLRNGNANIDELGFGHVYNLFGNDADIVDLMGKRKNLPAKFVEKIFVIVSDEVKRIMTSQYNIPMKVADSSAHYARELATLGLIDQSMSNMDTTDLVVHLHAAGRLNTSLVIRSLCLGNLRFFEHAMAVLSGISVINAQLLILDNSMGFDALYKKTELPIELFPAIRHLLKIVIEETNGGRYQRSDFKKILTSRLLEDKNIHEIDYMDYIITIIQNNQRSNAQAC